MSVNDEEDDQVDRARAAQIINTVRDSGRTILTEYESKQLLACYGIPTVDTRIAQSKEEAVQAANAIGYPVVLKIHSETITHKTDVGGVQLNLTDAAAVQNAYESIEQSVTEKVGVEHFLGVTVQPMAKIDGYELILGSSIDPQFGPVLLFGLGGQLVEVFNGKAPELVFSKPTNGRADRGAFMLVGVEIPVEGCWQITGTYKNETLTFTVLVKQ